MGLSLEKGFECEIKNISDDWTLLIAGKGHEDYQIKGKIKYRFSDEHVFKVTKNTRECSASGSLV